MFVIGIPTLNEADNISRLVKQIDEYAVNLGKEIIKLRLNINFESHSRQFIKSSDILSSNDIENLKLRALFLLQEEKQYPHGLSEVEWDGILSNTINNIYRYSSEEHSLYLLPLYLLRVYNYLKYN